MHFRPLWRLRGLLVLLLLLASACAGTPAGRATAPSAAAPAGAPPLLYTRPEGQAVAPCGPLWAEGGAVTLRGLYRSSGGGAYLDVWHLEPDALPCWARFIPDRDLGLGEVAWDEPLYLEIRGRPDSSRWSSPGLWNLAVRGWSELPLDLEMARRSCQAAVADRAEYLRALDWGALALPAFVTSTAAFRFSAEDLSSLGVRPLAADEVRPVLILELRGPQLPQVRPLVFRWLAFECHYDLERGRVGTLVATIQGEVQE